jgi:hypothetical protein
MEGDEENTAQVVPEAEAEEVNDQFEDDPPELVIGEPFALASGNVEDQEGSLDLIQRDNPEERKLHGANAVQGCIATIGCRCGKMFIMDLLKLHTKNCPFCKARYTSILMVADTDDTDILRHLTQHLLDANGQLADPEEESPDADE